MMKSNKLLSIFSLFFVTVFVSLGCWQIYKGKIKQESEADLIIKNQTIYRELKIGDEWSRVSLEGNFDTTRQILFDNQVLRSRPGFRVLTPFTTTEGTLLLVDRGWVEKSMENNLPIIDISLNSKNLGISGTLFSPQRNIAYGNNLISELWPKVSQIRDMDFFNKQYPEELYPLLLHLDPQYSFVFEYVPLKPFSVSSTKHFSYAFQWFLMGGVLLFMYLYTLRKKTKHEE